MTALVFALSLIAAPFLSWYVLYVLARIAEYRGNPVINIVEEYRKKYSHTNEN